MEAYVNLNHVCFFFYSHNAEVSGSFWLHFVQIFVEENQLVYVVWMKCTPLGRDNVTSCRENPLRWNTCSGDT